MRNLTEQIPWAIRAAGEMITVRATDEKLRVILDRVRRTAPPRPDIRPARWSPVAARTLGALRRRDSFATGGPRARHGRPKPPSCWGDTGAAH